MVVEPSRKPKGLLMGSAEGRIAQLRGEPT